MFKKYYGMFKNLDRFKKIKYLLWISLTLSLFFVLTTVVNSQEQRSISNVCEHGYSIKEDVNFIDRRFSTIMPDTSVLSMDKKEQKDFIANLYTMFGPPKDVKLQEAFKESTSDIFIVTFPTNDYSIIWPYWEGCSRNVAISMSTKVLAKIFSIMYDNPQHMNVVTWEDFKNEYGDSI